MRRSSLEMRSKGYRGHKEAELRDNYIARQFVSEYTLEPHEKSLSSFQLTNRNVRDSIKK